MRNFSVNKAVNKPRKPTNNKRFLPQTREREEDQRTLNGLGESLRLLGNTLIALSDVRCNLAARPPRHLHVVRPGSHYTDSTARPSVRSEDQGRTRPVPPSQTSAANQHHGQETPRVIRITHQTVEPVVMMQMNPDGTSVGLRFQDVESTPCSVYG